MDILVVSRFFFVVAIINMFLQMFLNVALCPVTDFDHANSVVNCWGMGNALCNSDILLISVQNDFN